MLFNFAGAVVTGYVTGVVLIFNGRCSCLAIDCTEKCCFGDGDQGAAGQSCNCGAGISSKLVSLPCHNVVGGQLIE